MCMLRIGFPGVCPRGGQVQYIGFNMSLVIFTAARRSRQSTRQVFRFSLTVNTFLQTHKIGLGGVSSTNKT